MPTARDPWVILAQAPGVLMNSVNVGGNLAGQQAGTASRGDYNWNNTWTLDGVEITDVAAIGASSIYYDFDSFQEMQVTTGGARTQQTSGVAVNVVTRGGTDVFRGSGRLLVTDDSLESQNLDDALRRQGAGAGNPIKNIKDIGVEAGGPLKTGRAWIWGGYGRQDAEVGVVNFYKKTGTCEGLTGATAINYPLETVRDCMQPSLTTVWAANVKAQVQLSRQNKLTWLGNATEKVSPNRGASDLRPIETTWRSAAVSSDYGPRLWKTGPSSIWKIGDQHVASDRWMLDLQVTHQGSNFALDFQESALAEVQPAYEITTLAWRRSSYREVYLRPTDSATFATEYFWPSAIGGDHAIQAGWRWRGGDAYAETHWGGNTVARYRNGAPAEADLYRDAVTNFSLDTQSAWVQDAYTRNRLTVTIGLRWDRQGEAAEASSVPAHPFQGQVTAQGVPFGWLPAVTFAGADGGPVWNDLSPRAGVTYDVRGDARTVLKASFARYYAQRAAGWLSWVVNPVSQALIRFPWRDANGDAFVQVGELDTARILFFSGNYNPDQPGQLGTDNRIDPGIDNYRTDEIVAGVDHEIAAEFAVGAAYIWRRYTDVSMSQVVGLSSADYVARTFTPPPANCPQPSARCDPVEYWEPTFPLPSTVLMTNRPDYDRGYKGLEVTARRRMRDGWMLDASVSFNDTRQHYRSPRSYQDPTNIDTLDGGELGVDMTGAGYYGITPVPNATWMAKVSGVYTLPWWDIAVAGFYQARQGYPFFQQVQTPSRANRAGTTVVILDRVGDVRYPALHLLDLGASKTFRIGPLRIAGAVDAFNVANVDTVLARRLIQNSATANTVGTIVAPRVIRLGARVSW